VVKCHHPSISFLVRAEQVSVNLIRILATRNDGLDEYIWAGVTWGGPLTFDLAWRLDGSQSKQLCCIEDAKVTRWQHWSLDSTEGLGDENCMYDIARVHRNPEQNFCPTMHRRRAYYLKTFLHSFNQLTLKCHLHPNLTFRVSNLSDSSSSQPPC
jgi:hypothetical protein